MVDLSRTSTDFLIVVDAHSLWPEVIPMTSTTATATNQELRRLFAAYGLPDQLVSDQWTSIHFLRSFFIVPKGKQS